MQRSSESIASLAAALAKAQIELVNPEKSLTATIQSTGGADQTFRYAPLSSGLDIVRKTLGQHEIAAVLVDGGRLNGGTINLTTWPAPGSEDTELGVFMEPEVSHGETEVYPRVQA